MEVDMTMIISLKQNMKNQGFLKLHNMLLHRKEELKKSMQVDVSSNRGCAREF